MKKLTDNENKATHEASGVSTTNRWGHPGSTSMVSPSHPLSTVDEERHPEAMLGVAEDSIGWHV
jgi:hypothetical protein